MTLLKKKKKQCIYNFTNEIFSECLSPFHLDKQGMGQAVPCVYTDRYQALPSHVTVPAASITGTGIELMIR